MLCSRAMHLALLSAALMAASAATPSDLEFLRSYAQTRAWVLGRPTKVTVLPDGSAVLFLRAQARKAENRLFRFDVASGKIAELVTPEQALGNQTEQLSAEGKGPRAFGAGGGQGAGGWGAPVAGSRASRSRTTAGWSS